MRQPKSIAKYLDRYAEAETQALETFPGIAIDNILVVPFYRETTAFPQRFVAGDLCRTQTLVIAVINQPPGPEEPQNRALADFFLQREVIWRNDNLTLCRENIEGLHWLVVDRFSAGNTIDSQYGVGLARKLGCDLAAALVARGRCNSEWIYTTDADAHLPTNYFSAQSTLGSSEASAAVFATKHISPGGNTDVYRATQLYERALDYYVCGLHWAGSPYAFPTIGSAVAIRAKAYCEARGFPKKAGGEDFYLLNKLAKLGAVSYIREIQIAIESRVSTRVPFGTGPAVEKILALANPDEHFTYYAPKVFLALRQWISHIPNIWGCIQQQENPLANLPDFIQNALNQANIDELWGHIERQIKTAGECERAIHHWFDAFQTLKFIRRLQDSCYPALPLKTCLEQAPFMQECTT